MPKLKPPHKPRSAGSGDLYIGERIREARMALGMTQSALADTMNISFQQIQKYEKGVNRLSLVRCEQIAKAVGKPVSFFMKTDDKIHIKPNPMLSRFISSREGFQVASKWFEQTPATRNHMLALITHNAAK